MNKRILLFASLFLLNMTTMTGQVSLGGFAGLNSSSLSGDAPLKAKYKSLIGLNAGLFVDFKLGDNLSLSFQPSYSQEGTRVFYKVSGSTEPVDSIRVGLDYFSLPLFIKIEATNNRFYALTGVETGLLLNAAKTIGGQKEDLDMEISEVNIAMHFGAGMHIPVGNSRMFVELRYSQGVVNLTDEFNNEHIIPRVKTAGFKLLAGYVFSFRKSGN